ncbi:MAG: hypothetical protein RLY43_220, partial [Bacteroidota bacterium]
NIIIGQSIKNTHIGVLESNIIFGDLDTCIVGSAFASNKIMVSVADSIIYTECFNNTFGLAENLILGTAFQCNNISQTDGDFTAATHVYQSYDCNLFYREDGTAKLSYVNNSDALTIVDATA